jgi:predicted glutamine amidotransferase
MCEIAVVDPEQADATVIHQIAAKFNEEQGDGLGVLAVQDTGDTFNYETYKSTNPHWQTMFAFLQRNWEDTWRFVVHGRAATAGRVNRKNSHPVPVDCSECEYDYVVHNGSVRNHKNVRAGLTSQGHSFETPVDSEVLAHKVQELPETVEDHDRNTYLFRGNLNYLLFSENGILVRVSSKYHLTDYFTMTCSFEEEESIGFEEGDDTEWMLIEPGNDDRDIETKEREETSRRGSWNGWASGSDRRSKYAGGGGNWRSNSRSSDDTHTIEYVDQSNWDGITAIEVAPGVMKVIDDDTQNHRFIKREEDPEIYSFYSGETTEAPGRQSSLDESFPDEEVIDDMEPDEQGNVAKAAANAAAQAVASTVETITVEDVAEVEEEVEAAITGE